MKFASFAIAALAGTTSAEFNLRAAANNLQRPSSSDPAEARVVIHGLTEDASLEDLEVIEKSAIAAYNSAYEIAGYSLKSFEAQLSATVPDMADWMPDCRFCPPDDDAAALNKQTPEKGLLLLATVQSSWNPDCRFCPPDDDASAIKQNLGDLHKDFENKFCASLRALGSANLANARDCYFAFLDMPGQSGESLPIETATLTSSAGKKIESQVVLHGTLHDLTKEDQVILDDSILAAYNEAFSKVGYTLESFESVSNTDIDTVGRRWYHWHPSWSSSPDCRL
jgi:DNA-binding protein YbaB